MITLKLIHHVVISNVTFSSLFMFIGKRKCQRKRKPIMEHVGSDLDTQDKREIASRHDEFDEEGLYH